MNRTTVTTSWDDGHVYDIKLAQMLKQYNIAGTFYISPENRELLELERLNKEEVIELSKNFEIGAHTVTHPRLSKITDSEAGHEIAGSKKFLEEWIGKEVKSFCYPGGDFKPVHETMVKAAGFKLARTVKRYATQIGNDPFAVPTTVHAYRHLKDIKLPMINLGFDEYLHWDVLANKLFDDVMQKGGVFHLWGHSWEIDKHKDWERLERVLKYISNRPEVSYLNNGELI